MLCQGPANLVPLFTFRAWLIREIRRCCDYAEPVFSLAANGRIHVDFALADDARTISPFVCLVNSSMVRIAIEDVSGRIIDCSFQIGQMPHRLWLSLCPDGADEPCLVELAGTMCLPRVQYAIIFYDATRCIRIANPKARRGDWPRRRAEPGR